ncbi:hypothetical protein [Albatrosspox virus]|nr:hypothetical protein [Albatrosspox virus]
MDNNTNRIVKNIVLRLTEEQYASVMKCNCIIASNNKKGNNGTILTASASATTTTNNSRKSVKYKRFRCAIFKLKNYTEKEYESLKRMSCKYMIMSKDMGSKNLYGYIEFSNRMTSLKLNKINNRIYWKKRAMPQKQLIHLFKNNGNYIEIGKRRRQGRTPAKRITK